MRGPVAFSLLLAASIPASANVFFVNTTADLVDVTPGDGFCFTSSFNCSLRAAVMEANALPGPHSILLPAGTYLLTLPGLGGADQGDLDITRSIAITGSATAATLIDGNGQFRVFDVAAGATLALRDLTVQHGFVEDTCGERCLFQGEFGGGIRNFGTTLLFHVRLYQNRTLLNQQNWGGHGGAIHNAGTLATEDCEFVENQATGSKWDAYAGAIDNFANATATIVRTSFLRNKASVPKGGGGGAIFNWRAVPEWPGGPLPEAKLEITDSRFIENEAGMPGQLNTDGGAISNYGSLTIRRTTLARNRNWGGGAGGAIINRGTLTLINCTFSANFSTGDGGGVATDPVFTIRNSTFTLNSGGSGAGFKGPADVWNSILSGNIGSECGFMTSHGYNLVKGSCSFTPAAGDKTGVDPLLLALANNGGYSETHALDAASPAVDSGNPSATGPDACAPVDQRGVIRPQGPRCDMGAYELIKNRPPVADAGVNRTVPANASCQAVVTLFGTGSHDPDGDPLTYSWAGPFGTATGPTATVTLPLGVNTITLTVNDGRGGIGTATITIRVVDATSPVISSAVASPNLLWPPNLRMVPVKISVSVRDACDPNVDCRIASVSSNEPVDSLGDWVITGKLTLDLRAERTTFLIGRMYTIVVECTDAAGDRSQRAVYVRVP